jgi:eukaryotic-like serine/threonine-protein kinase
MGDVYRATDSVLARAVAVKLLSDRYAQQDDARARFRREALAAARLSHAANVVTVFDVAEHRGRPLIVMEYIDGGTVHERLRSGAVGRTDALLWLEQAARALDRAHE